LTPSSIWFCAGWKSACRSSTLKSNQKYLKFSG
jgi:hypothetical protein